MLEKFNDANWKKRSGPLPHDHIAWHERRQSAITLPKLSHDIERERAEAEKPKTYACMGDRIRAEAEARRNAEPALPGRYAIPPDEDRRARSVGSITVKLQVANHTPAGGQKTLRVRGKGRAVWTPEMRRAASLRNMGNKNSLVKAKRQVI